VLTAAKLRGQASRTNGRLSSIGQAAWLLSLSPDTMRLWADAGRVPPIGTRAEQRLIDDKDLATFSVDPPMKRWRLGGHLVHVGPQAVNLGDVAAPVGFQAGRTGWCSASKWGGHVSGACCNPRRRSPTSTASRSAIRRAITEGECGLGDRLPLYAWARAHAAGPVVRGAKRRPVHPGQPLRRLTRSRG
jgi:hypothetical protein